MPDRDLPVHRVVWKDAYDGEAAWLPWEEAVEFRPRLIVTVGILLSETEDELVLALSYDSDADRASHVIHIPAGMVVESVHLLDAG